MEIPISTAVVSVYRIRLIYSVTFGKYTIGIKCYLHITNILHSVVGNPEKPREYPALNGLVSTDPGNVKSVP